MADIDFYCGVNEMMWNHHPVEPGPMACISPVYGKSENTKRENAVNIPDTCDVLQDSGAFSDGPGQRLSFRDALDRQIDHAERYGYAEQVTHRASYDLLIDEVWTEGNRHKRRWSVSDAESAVDETVHAAEFMARHKDRLAVLSAQGVDANQYYECSRRVIPLLESTDVLGLGGWCITGKMPAIMMPVFRETIRVVIPFAGRSGVRRVHIWGVLYAPALGELLWMCDQYGIALSTDSAGPTLKPAMGEWGYMGWRDRSYKRPPVETRGLERTRHVVATREWLGRLRETRYYKEPRINAVQLALAL